MTEIKFLTDAMFGKLTRFLRMFGYDTVYANDLEDDYKLYPMPDNKLLEYAIEHDRIIITKDLPFHKTCEDRSIYLNGDGVYNYLRQLKNALGLEYNINMKLARCSLCNSNLEFVEDNNSIKDSVKDATFKYYNVFYQCVNCKKVFWKGSHIDKITKKLEEI